MQTFSCIYNELCYLFAKHGFTVLLNPVHIKTRMLFINKKIIL